MTEHTQSPLIIYLQQLLLESGLCLERFLVEGLGYHTSVEGIQEYTNLLIHGCGSVGLINRLRRYERDRARLDAVLNELQGHLNTEAEAAIAAEVDKEQRFFTPHICADYESIGPSLRRVSNPLEGIPTPTIRIPPEISKLPLNQQLPLLKPLIQEHYATYGHIVEGNERIDGYRAWLSLADWNQVNFQLFDIEGNHILDAPSPIPKPIPPRRSRRAKRRNTLKQDKRR